MWTQAIGLIGSQNCSMFPLAFVAGWLQGHWWDFISRNYIVWPTFRLMNVSLLLKDLISDFYLKCRLKFPMISLHSHAVLLVSSLGVHWIVKNPRLLHVDSKDSESSLGAYSIWEPHHVQGYKSSVSDETPTKSVCKTRYPSESSGYQTTKIERLNPRMYC